MTTFGKRFKQLRIEKGLTQENLAVKFYTRKCSISKYENDIQAPDIDTIKQYALFFDCSIDYLLGSTDIRNHNINILNTYIDTSTRSYINTEGLLTEEIEKVNKFINHLKQKHRRNVK